MRITVAQLTGSHEMTPGVTRPNVILQGVNDILPAYPDVSGEDATKTVVCFCELQPAVWAGESYQPRTCTLRLDGEVFTLLLANEEIDMDKSLDWLNTNGEIANGPENVTQADGLPCSVVDCVASELSELDAWEYKGQL